MIFKKRQKVKNLTPEEKVVIDKINEVHRKLFPWTLLNIIPGILIGYFTWFYYFFVILGQHIFWNKEGFENILGYLLLYVAPIFSILGLISISVTVISRFTYRPVIAKKFYELRKVSDKLWNSSVLVCICATIITIIIRYFVEIN
jgi:hypothetical protein